MPLISLLFFMVICKSRGQDLLIIDKYGENSVKCLTNSSLALIWNSPLISNEKEQKSEFIPNTSSYFNCEIEDNPDPCNPYWQINPWIIKNSLESDIDSLILDRRWEGLKIHTTTIGHHATYIPVATFQKVSFEVPISARLKYEGHIFLCDGIYPPDSNCYWFLAGGWGGNNTALRKCPQGYIKKKNGEYPAAPCNINLAFVNHTKGSFVFNELEWRHFWIVKKGNQLSFWSRLENGDRNLILEYNDDSEIFDVKHLIIHSKDVKGLWKIHDYNFTYSEEEETLQLGPVLNVKKQELCVSLFLITCKTCIIDIKVADLGQNYAYFQNTYTSTEWIEVKIHVENLDVEEVILLVTTLSEGLTPFWGIDDVRQCHPKEFRQVSIYPANKFNIYCQLLTYDILNFQKNSSVSENSCSFNTVGEISCIPCNWIYENCNFVKFCYWNNGRIVCSCSSGYIGEDCYSECPNSYYGFGCGKQCGQCYYKNTCNNTNGVCYDEFCEDGFTGPKCDLALGLVFKNPPKVDVIAYTSCKLTINTKVNSYNSKPHSYIIQYKEENETNWRDYEKYDITEIAIEISELNVDTTYYVRAIAVGNEEIIKSSFVPFATFKTACKDFISEDLQVDALNTSMTFIFNVKHFHCKVNRYEVSVNNRQPKQVYGENGYFFDQLTPYTEYILNIKNRINSNVISKIFRTKEGKSSKIRNLKQIDEYPTNVTLKWDDPLSKNGVIRYFTVVFTHTQYKSCKNKKKNENSKGTLNVSSNSITIEKLIPFSQYTIEIFAYTSLEGEKTLKQCNTSVSVPIQDNEIPDSKFTFHDTFANFTFAPVSCSSLFGPLTFTLQTSCNKEWCKILSNNIAYKSSGVEFLMRGLVPFSRYHLIIEICRKKQESCRIIGFEDNFHTTKPAIPPKLQDVLVYSKSDNSIALRVKPPYPPNGILRNYKVRYQYYGVIKNSDWVTKKFSVEFCPLWPKFQCITLMNLYGEKYYTIEIQARNEEPTRYSEPFYLDNIYTEIEAPQPPYALHTMWIRNDLMILWNHPNITNGHLKYFEIKLIPEKGSAITKKIGIFQEQITYNYSVNEKLKESSKYIIEIKANNGFDSRKCRITILSPPPIPVLAEEPVIEENCNNSIKLRIEPLKNPKKIDKSVLYIFVSDKEEFELPQELRIIEERISSRLVYKMDNFLKINKAFSFIIGDNNKLKNFPLKPKTFYNITIVLLNFYKDEINWNLYQINSFTVGNSEEDVNNGLFALFILLLIPIILLILYKQKKFDVQFWKKSNVLTKPEEDQISLTTQPCHIAPMPKQKDMYSCPVKIENFEKYVKESVENDELDRQHALFPRGQTQSWECGALKVNKPKNRYNNLIAYDHSRVVLGKIENDPNSDYINANYIDSYKIPKAYIATQGPKKATLNDFWRMIWQENIHHIIMLANIYESGKKKVEQYWPNINEELHFHSITVQFLSNRIFADYEYRIFNVTCKKHTRKVEHLHFTTWPDHGVPLYSQSLVPFLQKMLKISPSPKSPILVHCSAGVGRTGTILLCDISLRMAAREGLVDILNQLQKIRDQRPNMVDNIEQYKLAHLVILECLVGMHTSIPCAEIESSVAKILANDLVPLQMRYLIDTQWQDEAMKMSRNETSYVIEEKNRFKDIIPEIQGRIFLPLYQGNDNSYINAVKVDGFRCLGRFIVTQQPMPGTLSDFWRLVESQKVSVIVSLNDIDKMDKSCCNFWPDKGNPDMSPVDFITLKYSNTRYSESYNVVSVQMFLKQEKEHRTIEIVILKNWPSNAILPKNIDEFLAFWEESDVLCRKSHPALITCYDGAKSSGIYVAMSFIIEKIKLEQTCDVCQAVRVIRHNRWQFIEEKEQFKFLYEAAVKYVNGFQSYANFN